eukprot:CAMPEP_0205811296 /NCGR_PEP_ID=MMETSP0205-20121125/15476_1 /ASSEMBLY_ACC=CAM_ASM_000278 /TAXON_ID=36767 /ORGANISM="Euplotes focardii, Strain TN1" /LENGTH=89 /DNA_ID=CAMNT_0053090285 /DNA_START=535 /DNA_END=805 /DNA_ORIENTATION=+
MSPLGGKQIEEDDNQVQEPNNRDMEGSFDQLNNQQPPALEENKGNNGGVMGYLRKSPAASLMDNIANIKNKWKKNFAIQDSMEYKEAQK